MNSNVTKQKFILQNPDETLSALRANGTMTSEDVLAIYVKMKKDEIIAKHKLPAHPSSDGYYHMAVRDTTKKGGQRQFKARTIEELTDKIVEFELSGQGMKEVPRTFSDVFQMVQKQKLSLVKDKQKRASVLNTVDRNQSQYRRYFAGTDFENMPVQQITKRDVEKITLENLTRYNLRKKSYLSMRSILKSVFDYAFSEYWINDNPYLRTDFHKFKDMVAPDVPIERRAHSDETVERILNFLHDWQEKKPGYLPAYALELQIIMGLRRGEVPPLMWSDIRDGYVLIAKEQVTVKKGPENAKEYCMIVDHTKTYKDRHFPITDELEVLLTRIRAAHDRQGLKSKYLFPADSANGVITNNTVYEFYRRMCRKLDIPISREELKGTHSFRRNAISKVVNSADGNLIMASQLFGNSPEVARKNYYTGLDLEKARAVLNG